MITAVDINPERVKILEERTKLLGVQNIKIVQYDSKKFNQYTDKKFNRILVDPPCSSSGTYSSRPENKWKLNKRDLRWYVDLQTDLLEEASRLITPNGVIVYSTCSLFHDENQHIITSFLEENDNFSLEKPFSIICASSIISIFTGINRMPLALFLLACCHACTTSLSYCVEVHK